MNVLNRNVRYLLMALLFACANATYAASIAVIYLENGDSIYFEYDSRANYAAVTKRYYSATNTLTPYVGDITIPENITVKNVTYPVKYINTDAFQGCTSLQSVTLPKKLERIYSRAFFGCTALSTITIPSSVEEIGQAAFYGCTSLSEVYGLQSSKIKTIGANAFCQCSNLRSINLPNTIEIIGNSAFENATHYSTNISLTLPESLKRIGDKAFMGVSLNLLHIPSSVVNIGSRAFDTYGCSTITVASNNNVYDSRDNCNAIIDKWNGTLLYACNNTTIPHGLTGIASYAFSHCMALTSIEIPQTITSIGSYAFFECLNLRSVKILGDVSELQECCFNSCPITELVLPNTIKKIGPSALNSLSVETLVLPNGLYFIGDGAISSSRLKNLVIPSTVSYIGSKAVQISVTSTITMEGDVPGYVSEDAFGTIEKNYNPLDRFTLRVKNEYYDNYYNHDPWSYFHEIQTYNEELIPDPLDDIEQVDNVELYDGQSYTYNGYRKAETLTYIRNFGNTNWQAWYVPFPMAYNDWKDNFEVARLNAIRMYDSDDDGEYDETELEIIKVKSGNIYPNHPYFIKAKNEGAYTFTLNNVVVYPAESKSIDCSTVETQFSLTGTYDVVTGLDMVVNRYYALSKGQLCYTTNTNAYLNPNRWYMKITERGKQVFQNTNLSRMRVIVKGEDKDEVIEDFTPYSELFDGEQTATGICTSPTVDTEDNAPIFTLEGTRLNANKALMPGVYIKNGKKYVVR